MPGVQQAVPAGASDQASLAKKLSALVVVLEDAAEIPTINKVPERGLAQILSHTELDALEALDQLPAAELLEICRQGSAGEQILLDTCTFVLCIDTCAAFPEKRSL